jgi:two-component system cell cycle response regulator DivK
MNQPSFRTAHPRPVVLLVDGHADSLALYALGLFATGFDVVPAKDGAEAVARAYQTHPDIIVTELPMADYDGWQFLQDLKQSPHTRGIPVVAMSDHVKGPICEQPEHDGFAAFLTRSCLPDELAEGLRRVLHRKTHATSGR